MIEFTTGQDSISRPTGCSKEEEEEEEEEERYRLAATERDHKTKTTARDENGDHGEQVRHVEILNISSPNIYRKATFPKPFGHSLFR